MRRLALLGALLMLGGCGGNSTETSEAPLSQPDTETTPVPTGDRTTTAVPQTTAAPHNTPTPEGVTPSVSTVEQPVTFDMPEFTGVNLQLAQDTLQSLGSYLVDQEDASGLGRLQVLDSNWQVCSQSPVNGSLVSVDAVVLLASVKIGETCP